MIIEKEYSRQTSHNQCYVVIMLYTVDCLTCNQSAVNLSPIKGFRCFLEQETLPLLLSTSWFLEQIQA